MFLKIQKMDKFKSLTDQDIKCKNCNELLNLKKQISCTTCSKFYIEFLFCKKCSIKGKGHIFGILPSNKYCLNCYIAVNSSVEKSKNFPQESKCNNCNEPLNPKKLKICKLCSKMLYRIFIL